MDLARSREIVEKILEGITVTLTTGGVQPGQDNSRGLDGVAAGREDRAGPVGSYLDRWDLGDILRGGVHSIRVGCGVVGGVSLRDPLGELLGHGGTKASGLVPLCQEFLDRDVTGRGLIGLASGS